MRKVIGLVLGGWCLTSLCLGASLQVNPVLQEIPVGETTAVYRVLNTGEQPVTVQVSALVWQQENGARATAPAEDVQITPPIMSLSPGQYESVRVALKTERADYEQAFRVIFAQVPETAQTLSAGIRTLIRLDTPLFFQAQEPHTELEWALHHDEEGWHLQLTNTGTRYGRLTQLVLEVEGNRRLPIAEGVTYILPGMSRAWPLDLTEVEARGGLSLMLVSEGQVQFQPLTIE